MRQDCARPSAARAPTSSGNTDSAGAAPTSGVAAATALQATRLASITRGPPMRSATKPRGTCGAPRPLHHLRCYGLSLVQLCRHRQTEGAPV
jgi:hypothetical protein